MKKIILLVFLFFCTSGFCQDTHKIAYKFSIAHKPQNFKMQIKTYLTTNGKVSLYEEDFIGENAQEQNNNFSIKSKKNPTFYKNLTTKTIIYDEDIRMKPFKVEDSISDFDWKITNETKTILGYRCQKAKLFFRGRNYEVYFTTQLPYQDGPWKFFGLPGLILESKSDDIDSTYEVVAEKIELTKELLVNNPFLDKKTIPYTEFVEIYKSKYYESVANNAQKPGSFVLPKGYREIYIID